MMRFRLYGPNKLCYIEAQLQHPTDGGSTELPAGSKQGCKDSMFINYNYFSFSPSTNDRC